MIPEALADTVVEKRIPVDVQFELTWRCNQQCIHCYQYQAGKDELDTATVCDIISQLAESGTLYLAFTGGEPLLRQDFWQIAEFAARKHFALLLQTNATLIGLAEAKRIAELPLVTVHISILGISPHTHDSITQLCGSFAKMMRAIELLRQHGARVVLNLTLMKQNFNEYPAIQKLKEDLGPEVDIRVSPYIYYKNDGSAGPGLLRLSDEQLREFLKMQGRNDSSRNQALLCNFGFCGCTINAKGEVYPCVAVPLVCGNLRQQRFSEIWAKSPVLTRIRSTDVKDLGDCTFCSLKNTCFRCSGFSYMEGKNLFGCSKEARRIARITQEVK